MKQRVQKLVTTSSKKINQLDAEILLAHVIKKSREFLFTNPDFEINFWQKIKFENLVIQRQKNIPVAYLVGHKEFFGLDFLVNKNVLVPRPDTELMVEETLKHLNTLSPNYNNVLLIDVGTGSGCIPISIRKSVLSAYPNLPTIAIDVSKKTLCVAKKHTVKIKFLHGNLLEPILKIEHGSNGLNGFEQIIVTANLPYITEQQFQNEQSIQHEPKIALVAENDGLALYEKILQQIKQITNTYNLKTKTYFEIDPTQTDKIKILIKKYLPESNIEVKKDLAGLDRLVIIK